MLALARPRYWIIHLVAIAAVLVTWRLGLWQWHAWEAHRAAEARDLSGAPAVPLDDLMGPDDPFPGDQVGQPVSISGTWVPSGTIYVADRIQGDQSGYWAVTPLAIGGPEAPAIEVVRGWAATLDDVPGAPEGTASLTGYLQPGEGTLVRDEDPNDDVLPQLRLADAIQHVDQDLYGGYVVATDRPGATNSGTLGLAPATVAQLPSVSRFTGIRNLFYAIEWWFFGLFVVFLWWRWVRDEQERWALAEAVGEPELALADQEVSSGKSID